MKKLLVVLLILLSTITFSQNNDVYAEFYNQTTGKVFITDSYQIDFYDNAEQIDEDSVKTYNSGFVARLIFTFDSDEDSSRIITQYGNDKNDEGVIRIRVWDTKLYGYCYVRDVIIPMEGYIMVTLVGHKNTPQRKKLLFKDSPKLRMWKYPWVGK